MYKYQNRTVYDDKRQDDWRDADAIPALKSLLQSMPGYTVILRTANQITGGSTDYECLVNVPCPTCGKE